MESKEILQSRGRELIDRLYETQSLALSEYEELLRLADEVLREYIAALARQRQRQYFSNKVFIRGLIEISNICKNDCYYCGIRKSNEKASRYRLYKDEILNSCEIGYRLGFRTFVMQGGEDGYYTDEVLTDILRSVKLAYPDVAITLSLGERSADSYRRLKEAGADRYLLRHETANEDHYRKLHPQTMSYDKRMQCLRELKEIGFQTGCGFMVGSPGQEIRHLARDLKFVEEFSPQMCGIGPFIPHKDTPFKEEKPKDVHLTYFLISIIRLISPKILLPATTALGSLVKGGREQGILSGANVVMPNLSPYSVREKYMLYNNKLSTGAESAQALEDLKSRMSAIGYEVVTERGDALVK